VSLGRKQKDQQAKQQHLPKNALLQYAHSVNPTLKWINAWRWSLAILPPLSQPVSELILPAPRTLDAVAFAIQTCPATREFG
jgi:hypothetical protein